MGKSYIRKRYEYMAVTTPAAMGGMFFLSVAGYSYGLIQPQTIIAAPMLGGSLSLFGWFLYEMHNLFNIKWHSKTYESTQPFFVLDRKRTEDFDFVFRGKVLKIELPKDRLEKFCKIGTKRQEEFFNKSNTLHSPYYKRLSKNTIWSERVFLDRNFLSEEVWTAKYILWSTGLFIEWNPGNQGKAGLSISTNVDQIITKAQRRWKFD